MRAQHHGAGLILSDDCARHAHHLAAAEGHARTSGRHRQPYREFLARIPALREGQAVSRNIIAQLAAASILIAAAGCGKSATSYSGTMQAEAPNIGSTVGGRVIAVLATTGQHVTKGQIIVQFDPKDQRAALAQAQGQMAQAEATLADLEAGPRPQDIAKANAQAEQAKHAYDQAL